MNMARGVRENWAAVAERWCDRPVRLAFVFLGLIALLKFPTLVVPPVWDEAFSVFPAAAWLARHGFAWLDLMGQPGYLDAGPNCHALSLATAWTAAAYRLFDMDLPLVWVALHLWNWVLGAAALAAAVRLFRLVAPASVALAAGAACLFYPLFHVQIGVMYLETPLLCAATLSALALARGQWLPAALGAFLATAVKESGVVLAGALAAALVTSGRGWSRFARAAFVAGPPAVLAVLGVTASEMTAGNVAGGLKLSGAWGRVTCAFWSVCDNFLSTVPDLTVLLCFGLLASACMALLGMIRAARGRPPSASRPEGEAGRVVEHVAGWIVFLMIVFHFIVFALVSGDFSFLPRYAVPVVPFLGILLIKALRSLRCPPQIVAGLLSALALLGLVNRGGCFYPEPRRRCPAVAERSEEYLDAFRTYRDGIRDGLAGLPDDARLFCGLPEYALLRNPDLGYTPRRFTGLINSIRAPPGKADPVYAVVGYPFLGGQRVRGFLAWAEGNPAFRVRTVYRGGYGMFEFGVVEVTAARGEP
jgi:hypothetical protein